MSRCCSASSSGVIFALAASRWNLPNPLPMALQRIADAVDQSLILILSDINMPGMSGLELLPKVRAMRPDVPIIMITAYGDAETKRQALENGAEALLTKPIDFGTLRSEIEHARRAHRIGCLNSPNLLRCMSLEAGTNRTNRRSVDVR